MKRSCGVLLPVTALPSPHGVGTLGKAAFDFVDFLAQAGQSWWQVLPLGPTGHGDSPYTTYSAYAGNHYLIDLDLLEADGLLTREEIEAVDWGRDPTQVDYAAMYDQRLLLLEKAKARGWDRDKAAVEAFVGENRQWLPDYALYMACKRHFNMVSWQEWPEDIRLRHPQALERMHQELREDVELFLYVQFLFFRQWNALRAHCREKNVGIIGDMPFYLALDSADVWADPASFQLDSDGVPSAVAGVPPDYFCADGQLWGNPLYNWEAMQRDGFGWWIRRVEGAGRLYDILRIDHFRAFASYWAVPRGETTARNGRWVQGPGMALVGVLTSWFPNIRFIAEDLGQLTPDVVQLLQDSGLPGMKILEFAFDTTHLSSYLPHGYPRNCVCYPGTHDNAPVMGWRQEAKPEEVAFAKRYLGLNEEEGFHWGFLRGGLSSPADLFVAQMQDYLGLGSEARTNTPGLPLGNWRWRLTADALTPELAERMHESARIYGRL